MQVTLENFTLLGGRYNIARTGDKRTERQRETSGRDERGVKRENESENEQERHGMG